MFSQAGLQDVNVTPPTAGTTPGLHITSLATSTVSATYDLSTFTDMFFRYLDITADGGKIYISFDNDSTGEIDQTVAGETIAAGTTEAVPWPIRDGEVRSYRLHNVTHRYLHVKADTGTPYLRICGSSQQGRSGE